MSQNPNFLSDIDNLYIENLMLNGHSLDFTGKVWKIKKEVFHSVSYKTYDKHTPLSFSIDSQDRELFLKLIRYGVDINHAIDDWEWLPLTYALKSTDSFFIKVLLKHPQLDIYKKIKNKSALNHLVSLVSLYDDEENEKIILKNIGILLDYLNKKEIFDFNNFFNTNPFMENIKFSKINELLLKKMPSFWLKILINQSVEQTDNNKPHIALMLFDMFPDNNQMIKKIISFLNINHKIANGNTVLHYYILNNYNSYNSNKVHKSKKVILALLKAGFNYELNNNNGQNVVKYLEEQEYFKEYLIIKKYHNLSDLLLLKTSDKIEKLIKI